MPITASYKGREDTGLKLIIDHLVSDRFYKSSLHFTDVMRIITVVQTSLIEVRVSPLGIHSRTFKKLGRYVHSVLPCLPSTVSDFGPVPNKNDNIMSPRTVPGCNKNLINSFQKISG